MLTHAFDFALFNVPFPFLPGLWLESELRDVVPGPQEPPECLRHPPAAEVLASRSFLNLIPVRCYLRPPYVVRVPDPARGEANSIQGARVFLRVTSRFSTQHALLSTPIGVSDLCSVYPGLRNDGNVGRLHEEMRPPQRVGSVKVVGVISTVIQMYGGSERPYEGFMAAQHEPLGGLLPPPVRLR